MARFIIVFAVFLRIAVGGMNGPIGDEYVGCNDGVAGVVGNVKDTEEAAMLEEEGAVTNDTDAAEPPVAGVITAGEAETGVNVVAGDAVIGGDMSTISKSTAGASSAAGGEHSKVEYVRFAINPVIS